MNFIPHEYQRLAIEKINNENSVGLLLDMGLGKTSITLSAIKTLIYEEFEIKKVLLIAPLQTARNTWTAERDKWDDFHDLTISLVLGSASERTKALGKTADIYVVNRENVQWLCDYYDGEDWPFDMLVVDELSSFKSPQAKRFKALRKKLPFFKKVVGLTGTPASNGYMDLWAEMYILDRGERLGKSIGNYRNLFFYPAWGNGHIVYKWELRDGAKSVIDKKISDMCISMKAVDYIDMPDRIETEFYVEMTDKERKLYDKFAREHIIPDKEIVGVNAAAVQNKLLQIANGFAYDEDGEAHRIHNHKLEALEELIESAGGENVLLYYSFIADKEAILEAFPQARELKSKRDVEDWNAGEIPMLVCHPASAGHGLNLQQGGHIILWFGLPWSLELYQQANARLHRQGQQKPVYIYHILTKNTHDEDVLTALKAKDMTQEALLKALKARIKECQTR